MLTAAPWPAGVVTASVIVAAAAVLDIFPPWPQDVCLRESCGSAAEHFQNVNTSVGWKWRTLANECIRRGVALHAEPEPLTSVIIV